MARISKQSITMKIINPDVVSWVVKSDSGLAISKSKIRTELETLNVLAILLFW